MRFLLDCADAASFDDVVALAEAAHRDGLDGVLLSGTPALPAPLVVAAALGSRVPDVRLAVEAPLGDRHPIEVAEETAVVDVASGGRRCSSPAPRRAARPSSPRRSTSSAGASPRRRSGPTARSGASPPASSRTSTTRSTACG